MKRFGQLVGLALFASLVAFLVPVTSRASATQPMFQGDLFWCTQGPNNSFCATTIVEHVTTSTPVRMACWVDDRAPFPNSSPRWFYVFLPDGTQGYAWAPQVNSQTPNTPPCSNANWIDVGVWATQHIGAVYPTSWEIQNMNAPVSNWGPARDWSGDCVAFVYLAWKMGAGTGGTLVWDGGNAVNIYNHYNNLGLVHHSGIPPRGAIVFFPNDSAYGHVGISLGDWAVVGTQGLDGPPSYPITMGSFAPLSGTYLGQSYANGAGGGWMMPTAATGFPQS